MTEIQKNVPVPKRKGRGPSNDRNFPLHAMREVGDSFFAPCDDKQAKTYGARVWRHTRVNPGVKMTLRRLTEGGVAGMRVWLLANKEAA